MIINSFRGEYAFLSNMYPCPVPYREITFPSSEHAYVYAKTGLVDMAASPKKIKVLGRKEVIKPNWNAVRVEAMRQIIASKFRNNPDLMEKLIATRPAIIIEGNYWNDNFWGSDPPDGDGKNWLGKILMEERDSIWNL